MFALGLAVTLIAAVGAADYRVTPHDELMLLRAVAAEGPPHTQVAQALISGFMAARSRGFGGSLSRYVESYAQPINPRWFPDGDLFRASLERMDEERRTAALARARHRTKLAARVIFDERTRSAVTRALEGDSDTHATDYASAETKRTAPWVAVSDQIPGENRFWKRPATLGWRGYWQANGTPIAVAVLAFIVWRLAVG